MFGALRSPLSKIFVLEAGQTGRLRPRSEPRAIPVLELLSLLLTDLLNRVICGCVNSIPARLSPPNSFIYRFYAKFLAKSFIYRIYVRHRGVGGLGFRIPAVTRHSPAPFRTGSRVTSHFFLPPLALLLPLSLQRPEHSLSLFSVAYSLFLHTPRGGATFAAPGLHPSLRISGFRFAPPCEQLAAQLRDNGIGAKMGTERRHRTAWPGV